MRIVARARTLYRLVTYYFSGTHVEGSNSIGWSFAYRKHFLLRNWVIGGANSRCQNSRSAAYSSLNCSLTYLVSLQLIEAGFLFVITRPKECFRFVVELLSVKSGSVRSECQSFAHKARPSKSKGSVGSLRLDRSISEDHIQTLFSL